MKLVWEMHAEGLSDGSVQTRTSSHALDADMWDTVRSAMEKVRDELVDLLERGPSACPFRPGGPHDEAPVA